MQYKRILIKLSGESLANKKDSLAIDYNLVRDIASQLREIKKQGVEITIVVGGGNFWRGVSAEKNGIQRNRADYIGMLATMMNSLALQSGFEDYGLKTRTLSSINIDKRVTEYYIKEKADKYLKDGDIIIFAGGTGRPFFTTDTASTLFASELGIDVILVGKNNVSGIYDSDPKSNANAKRFAELSYDEAIEKNLKVMDAAAFSMARDNDIQLIVFDIKEKNSIVRALNQDIEHTIVKKVV